MQESEQRINLLINLGQQGEESARRARDAEEHSRCLQPRIAVDLSAAEDNVGPIQQAIEAEEDPAKPCGPSYRTERCLAWRPTLCRNAYLVQPAFGAPADGHAEATEIQTRGIESPIARRLSR